MLKRHESLQQEETRKRYRKMGYDACVGGIDRGIADDFSVEYRNYVRQGWDEANADAVFKHFAELNRVKIRKYSQ